MELEMASPPDAGGPPPGDGQPSGAPAPGSPEEALRRLEQRLDQASEAAERLMAQVAAEAARAGRPTAGAGQPGDGAGNLTADAGNLRGGAGKPDSGAGDPPDPPPAGWQTADDTRDSTSELDPFVALVQAMRDLIPPDLQQRLIAALREVLLALRALIDWYLERLDHRRDLGVEVQDIPIL
jgi:hypothetical protein